MSTSSLVYAKGYYLYLFYEVGLQKLCRAYGSCGQLGRQGAIGGLDQVDRAVCLFYTNGRAEIGDNMRVGIPA
jgi:hypothetical protein